ncbi:TPA: helix-turn-helix domain-containing protein, partial [Salmonella enterica subsp. enterica serovar Muenchen]
TNSSKVCIHFSVEALYEYVFFSYNDFFKIKGIYRKDYIVIQSYNVGVITRIFNEFDCMEDQHIKKAAICFLLSCFHPERNFFPFFLSFYSMRHKISIIIKTDVKHQWRLREIASALCLCVSTVKKHLKKEETSFIKILTECRVQHAARLLLIGNKNISTISAECGYSSVSYFIMTFTAYYGLSPHQYAQKYSCL